MFRAKRQSMRLRTASAAWRSGARQTAARPERQAPRRFGGLSPCGEEVRKLRIGIEEAEVIAQGQVGIPLGQGGAGDPRGFLWDGADGLRVQGHGTTPSHAAQEGVLSMPVPRRAAAPVNSPPVS